MSVTELELFIEHARNVGAFRVVDFYEQSWLPYKAEFLRRHAEAGDTAVEPDIFWRKEDGPRT